MAKLRAAFPFIGTVGNFTYYKRRDIDEIIVRQKGGASKERIKKDKAFVNTRKVNAEFGGRSAASKRIISMLFPMKAVADHSFSGELNSLLRPVQQMDMENDWGKRSVKLSANPALLSGFSLNKRNPFDSIVRNPVSFELDRDNLAAAINLPALLPGINFFVPGKYPVFGFQATLGIVPDLFYDHNTRKYKPAGDYETLFPQTVNTDWWPVVKGSAATRLELNCPAAPPNQSFTLMLSLGIRFGTTGAANQVDQLKYAGAARIIALA